MKRLSIADIKASDILSIEEKKMVVGGFGGNPNVFYSDADCFVVSFLDMDKSSSLNGRTSGIFSSYQEARMVAADVETTRTHVDVLIENC